MAAGADILEELFEIYKVLVRTLAKAGIEIKSSKVEFGVEEIDQMPNLPPNIGQVAQPTQKRLKNVINVKLSRLVIKKQDV